MTVQPKSLFAICLLVSLLLHGAVSLLVHPVIPDRGLPVIFSWMDILSPRDLSFSSYGTAVFFRELYLPFDERSYFRSDPVQDKICFSSAGRGLFRSPRRSTFKKAEQVPINFKRSILSSLSAYEPKTTHLEYRAEITPKGRVLFATPLRLPFDTPAPLRVEQHLLGDLIFLGRDSFYWTSIKVVIE